MSLNFLSCPIMDYVTRRYSHYMYQLDVLPMPSTHVLGLHGAGRLFSDLTHNTCNLLQGLMD